MWTKYRIAVLATAALAVGCAPSTFVRQTSGWKVVELRPGLKFDRAWQEMVDTVAQNWDVEMLEKDSRYLKTTWHYGISGADPRRYRGRIIVKFPPGKEPTALHLKTEAEWLPPDSRDAQWIKGHDSMMQRKVYTDISGRVGRVIPR